LGVDDGRDVDVGGGDVGEVAGEEVEEGGEGFFFFFFFLFSLIPFFLPTPPLILTPISFQQEQPSITHISECPRLFRILLLSTRDLQLYSFLLPSLFFADCDVPERASVTYQRCGILNQNGEAGG
jgi:hypothetical protein